MNQKLIKLSDTHYIIVDDSEIKDGEWFYNTFNDNQAKIQQRKGNWKTCFNQHKITHSTKPLSEECKYCTGACGQCVDNIKPLSLSEVEEAINGYSVEKMALEEYDESLPNQQMAFHCRMGYKEGFKAHQELVKDKLFSIEDMKAAWRLGYDFVTTGEGDLQSLLPKTEWDIEFINDKITLI